MENHQLALKPGYVLEGFRIERVLGKGGFGITYLAVDVRLGKKVAIKELLPDSIATRVEGSTVLPQSSSQKEDWEWAKERFVEEARMLAGFSHPAIVGVHLLIEANGTAYMVMDYIEGESYEAKLKRIGTESDEAALMAVIGPVLEGLEQVHQRGLLHRDIKPDNILIKQDGQPVLIDFGAARESVGKTVTMTSIVTHGYSPIEQYQSKGKMGPWTDIYAVGAVICRATTGEKPPVATERIDVDEFRCLKDRELPTYSHDFLECVDTALRVKSQDRPKTLADWPLPLRKETSTRLRETDASYEASLPESSVSDRVIARADKPTKLSWQAICIAAACVVILCLTGLLVLQSQRQSKDAAAHDRDVGKNEAVAAVNEMSAEEMCEKGLALVRDNESPQLVSEGISLLTQAAEKGVLDAQMELGHLYYRGDVVPQDYDAAFKWLRKAADQGDATAQRAVGLCYLEGLGTGKSTREALKWIRAAAEQGHPGAQSSLGTFYSRGLAVEPDFAEAVKWFRKSAEQGDEEGEFNLGLMLQHGKGVRKDESEAMLWLLKAANKDLPQAAYQLGVLWASGVRTGDWQKTINSIGVKDYEALIDEAAAEKSGGDTYVPVVGFGSHSQAFKWFKKAAESGSGMSQLQLAVAYEEGLGVDANHAEADKWYKRAVENLRQAAEAGDMDSQRSLGIAYFQGLGTPPDSEEAKHWLTQAAAQGDQDAKRLLSEYNEVVLHQENAGEKAKRNKLKLHTGSTSEEIANSASIDVVGIPVPGQPGFVTSPYAPTAGFVDVREFSPGDEVNDPYSASRFKVPSKKIRQFSIRNNNDGESLGPWQVGDLFYLSGDSKLPDGTYEIVE